MSNDRPDDLDCWLAGDGPLPDDLATALSPLTVAAVPAELAGEAAVVAAMAEVLTVPIPLPSRGTAVLGRFSRRSLALAVAGTVAFGGVAAAASGTGPLGEVLSPGPANESVDETTTTSLADLTSTTVAVAVAVAVAEAADAASSTTTAVTTTTTAPESTTSTTTSATTTTSAPGAIVCPDGLENHGEYVSAVARDRSTEGTHGQRVSEAARSNCGKHGDDDEEATTTTTTVPTTSTVASGTADTDASLVPDTDGGNGNGGDGNGGNGNGGNGNGGNGNGRVRR